MFAPFDPLEVLLFEHDPIRVIAFLELFHPEYVSWFGVLEPGPEVPRLVLEAVDLDVLVRQAEAFNQDGDLC